MLLCRVSCWVLPAQQVGFKGYWCVHWISCLLLYILPCPAVPEGLKLALGWLLLGLLNCWHGLNRVWLVTSKFYLVAIARQVKGPCARFVCACVCVCVCYFSVGSYKPSRLMCRLNFISTPARLFCVYWVSLLGSIMSAKSLCILLIFSTL